MSSPRQPRVYRLCVVVCLNTEPPRAAGPPVTLELQGRPPAPDVEPGSGVAAGTEILRRLFEPNHTTLTARTSVRSHAPDLRSAVADPRVASPSPVHYCRFATVASFRLGGAVQHATLSGWTRRRGRRAARRRRTPYLHLVGYPSRKKCRWAHQAARRERGPSLGVQNLASVGHVT